MDELNGKRIGPYALADKIGEGGMAVVYKGYQESLNRYVAIKVLRGELARDQEFVTRFRREALAVAGLSHPNILHVYDAGQSNGMYYMVMDYADGGSLKDQVQRGPLEIERAVSIAIQLADALDYAHQQGLVHRDVKPSNVLLTKDGRPLLTDFGIAKALYESTHLTRTGTSIGTPEYMSPEQLQGQAVDGRTDIYALGVVLFEMLAGWSPFQAPTPMATLYKQLNEPVPPLRQVNITIPEWLEAVVNKALAKQPGARFQRASEMADALRQRQATLPAAAPPPARRKTPRPMPPSTIPQAATPQPVAKRRSSAVPILLGAILGLVLILGGIGAYLLLGGSPNGTATPTSATVVVAVNSPEPTDTLEPTAAPTDTPLLLPTDAPTDAPTVAVDTPTSQIVVVTATPEPETPTPTAEPVQEPAETAAPTATPTSPPPTSAPTKPPAPSGEPGVISDFENFGTWSRGDEPNGTFTQSSSQAHQGSYSGKLDYNFGTSSNDYVVFQQTHSIAGQPNRMTAWVYGDGQGHFLNAWIRDNGGQVWQVPLGRETHTGWQQMAGAIDVNQDWPWTHISGTDNGRVDYPITFLALVLDDGADTFSGRGTLYIDDLRADTGTVSTGPSTSPTAAPAAEPTSAPSGGVSGITGKIVYSAGGTMHIVNAADGSDRVAPIGGMLQPDMRSDGQLIIANGEGGGKTSLWSIDAKTGAFIREQSPFTNDFRPFWAPDGGQFAYDSLHHGGRFQGEFIVYKQVLDSNRDEALVHGGQQILGKSPVWMHDDWIAFTGCDYWPGGTGGSKCGIYRMPSWGGQPALVLQGALTMRPTDNYGGQLTYMSQDSGNWEVYVIPNKGGTPRNVSNSPSSHDGLGTFSPDGSMVAFVSNRGGSWAVWAVRVDGSGATKLFNLPAAPSGTWTEEHISWGP